MYKDINVFLLGLLTMICTHVTAMDAATNSESKAAGLVDGGKSEKPQLSWENPSQLDACIKELTRIEEGILKELERSIIRSFTWHLENKKLSVPKELSDLLSKKASPQASEGDDQSMSEADRQFYQDSKIIEIFHNKVNGEQLTANEESMYKRSKIGQIRDKWLAIQIEAAKIKSKPKKVEVAQVESDPKIYNDLHKYQEPERPSLYSAPSYTVKELRYCVEAAYYTACMLGVIDTKLGQTPVTLTEQEKKFYDSFIKVLKARVGCYTDAERKRVHAYDMNQYKWRINKVRLQMRYVGGVIGSSLSGMNVLSSLIPFHLIAIPTVITANILAGIATGGIVFAVEFALFLGVGAYVLINNNYVSLSDTQIVFV